jgi:hypothetical protein
VAVVAHCPLLGVKVYVVVDELFNTGDQFPIIELLEVEGKADNAAPEQIVGTWLNVGVTFGITLIIILPFVAH